MRHKYSISEILIEIQILQNTFHTVRLVNPSKQSECILTESDNKLTYHVHHCFSIWLKNTNCMNCISLKALYNKTTYTKFEFINDKIYYIIARYVKVNDMDLVLEMVTQINEAIQIDGVGYNSFIDRITKYNKNIYSDELTGAYNRRYLNEKLPLQINNSLNQQINIGLAIIDLDSFKEINDRFGHLTGDKVLGFVAHFLRSKVNNKKHDYLVRYGGDEFIVVFYNIEKDIFEERLQEIIYKVTTLEISIQLNINLTVSAGGACLNEVEKPTMAKIIELADRRLYSAKHNGRNQVIISN